MSDDELRQELSEYYCQRISIDPGRLYAPGASEVLPGGEFEAEYLRRSDAAHAAIEACLAGEIPKAAALTRIDQLSDHAKRGVRQGLGLLGWTDEALAWFVSHRRNEWLDHIRVWDSYLIRIRDGGDEAAKAEWIGITGEIAERAGREREAAGLDTMADAI